MIAIGDASAFQQDAHRGAITTRPEAHRLVGADIDGATIRVQGTSQPNLIGLGGCFALRLGATGQDQINGVDFRQRATITQYQGCPFIVITGNLEP